MLPIEGSHVPLHLRALKKTGWVTEVVNNSGSGFGSAQQRSITDCCLLLLRISVFLNARAIKAVGRIFKILRSKISAQMMDLVLMS